jgi:hypothetical protein
LSVHRYQLALVTPGILPVVASSRKQIRQIWNFLMKARERPQRRQRLWTRTPKRGFRWDLTINAVLANASPP